MDWWRSGRWFRTLLRRCIGPDQFGDDFLRNRFIFVVVCALMKNVRLKFRQRDSEWMKTQYCCRLGSPMNKTNFSGPITKLLNMISNLFWMMRFFNTRMIAQNNENRH